MSSPYGNAPVLEEKEGAVLLRVRLRPRAKRNHIERDSGGDVHAWVQAAPADNAANDALTAMAARRLGVSKGSVTVVKGRRSREKTLRIEGVTLEEVRERLG